MLVLSFEFSLFALTYLPGLDVIMANVVPKRIDEGEPEPLKPTMMQQSLVLLAGGGWLRDIWRGVREILQTNRANCNDCKDNANKNR